MDDYEKYNCEDWDGYGAKPITPETLAIGRAFRDLLSRPPDMAPAADGTIGFEWGDFEKGHKIFLDVNATTLSFYARIGKTTLCR